MGEDVKRDALKLLAERPPGFGRNILSEEREFIGNTYVYRGEYPRRDGALDHKVEKERVRQYDGGRGVPRFGGEGGVE
jgi:hypothetical protein